jgi:hypothetical protein
VPQLLASDQGYWRAQSSIVGLIRCSLAGGQRVLVSVTRLCERLDRRVLWRV